MPLEDSEQKSDMILVRFLKDNSGSMLKIHKRVQGCQKGARWDYCHNQDEVMGTCTEMEAVKMGRGDGFGHILKAESKEFLDKLRVKYEI